MNWYGIWALKKLGLARHVYRVKMSNLPALPPVASSITSLHLTAPSSSAASAD
jgi:hypothetical protein